MYNRINAFVNKNSLIYKLKFGHRQQYYFFHTFISFTEDIWKNLEKGNTDCGVFVNMQSI